MSAIWYMQHTELFITFVLLTAFAAVQFSCGAGSRKEARLAPKILMHLTAHTLWSHVHGQPQHRHSYKQSPTRQAKQSCGTTSYTLIILLRQPCLLCTLPRSELLLSDSMLIQHSCHKQALNDGRARWQHILQTPQELSATAAL